MSTYFKAPPPKTGLGLSSDNKPIKQEFTFYSGKKFVSTDSQFEQWPDGAKAWAFRFEQSFERGGDTLEFGTTAIIQEVDGREDEIRYCLIRIFNKNITNESNDEHLLKLDELPIQEQLAHKNLKKKLDILRIHLDYHQCQNKALIDLMKLLDGNKDENGLINEELLKNLFKKANFPSPEIMKSKLEKMAVNTDTKLLAVQCIKLISKCDKNAISEWFQMLAEEVKLEIDSYEKMGMDFPQYKYMLEQYEKSNQMLELSAEMLILMNPKIFQNCDQN